MQNEVGKSVDSILAAVLPLFPVGRTRQVVSLRRKQGGASFHPVGPRLAVAEPCRSAHHPVLADTVNRVPTRNRESPLPVLPGIRPKTPNRDFAAQQKSLYVPSIHDPLRFVKSYFHVM